jgi:hypothetical protein
MKKFSPVTVFLFILLNLNSGCSTQQRLVLDQPVGPAHSVNTIASGQGCLVVYSAWDRFDTMDSQHPKHTPYAVMTDTGRAVAHVRNQAGSFGQQPTAINLPPGRYWVQARARNVGPVRLPIVIREGRSTSVYLDGTSAPEAAAAEEHQWIRQPNGLIVGWKDNEGGL